MEEEIISHLSRFVSFRTVAGENEVKRECLEWLESIFLSQSCERKAVSCEHGEVEGCPYTLIKHPHPKLLWFAHTDVVPGKDEQFTLKQEGDKLIGRGAIDMKGNQLPFLLAYRDAIAEGKDPPVSILLTSDEETAGPTIPKLLKEGLFKDVPAAFTPDTTNRIVVEHKGVVWGNLRCKGKGSHGAYPWDGENPTYLLAEALQKIHKKFPDGTKEDWQLTIFPTQLEGSIARNQVPDKVTCGLDIRYPPQNWKSPEEVVAYIGAVLPVGCFLEPLLTADALGTDPNHPMVQLVKKIAEEVTGEEVQFEREHGGTDARYFGSSGIPSFLYGPVGEGLHGADEWVSLRSLVEQYEISRRLIQELT